jgi:uncharacterized protein YecT (DUF1311 family)
MKYILLFTCLLSLNVCYAQSAADSQVDVTEAVQAKLKQDVEKEIPAYTQKLKKLKHDAPLIEFEVDTFRIESLVKKWIALNYADYSMKMAAYEGAKQYDILLNKYYRKLMAMLTANDKQKLIQAQKAWILYRDSELKLSQAVNSEGYSGGTIEGLIDASDYSELIKTRTVSLFQYYCTLAANK